MKKSVQYIILMFLLFATSVSAIDYKEYKVKKKYKEYFQVEFSRHNDEFQIKHAPIMVTTGDQPVGTLILEENSIRINNKLYLIDNITGTKIAENNDFITITFYTAQDSSKLARFKRGNLISNDENLIVEEGDFVRGMIFSVSGDITIFGEVNKDVISLFGNINIVDGGVVRGDVASISGNINLDKTAILYGEIYDRNKKGRGSKHRRFRDKRNFDFEPFFSYDRVDGAAISLRAYHNDIDSLLPTLEAEIGIGFASDRGRYKFLIEQTLLRDKSIAIGGTFYRQLLSDDDWLIDKNENTFFALMAKEDYKDYYEAEGGTLYAKAVPTKHLTVKAGYSYYASNWLPSNRHLWTLLRGSDKLFDLNYNSWDSSIRSMSITEVDTSEIGALFTSVHYYSDSTHSETKKSNWHIYADFEFSQTGLNSDFDYHRYMITVRRLQEINRQSAITNRTVFGNSDGYLPTFKRFHLGGLSSLHGYAHKEYMGTRFWMNNLEYKIDFPRSEFGVSLFWDIGQIANDTKLNSDIEIKQSLGLSFFFEDDFTLSVAKRLDRSTNDSPKLYVRFNHSF